MDDRNRWKVAGKRLLRAVVVLAAIGTLLGIYFGFQLWMAWNRIERVEFDPEAVREELAVVSTTITADFFEDDAPIAFDDIDPSSVTTTTTTSAPPESAQPTTSPSTTRRTVSAPVPDLESPDFGNGEVVPEVIGLPTPPSSGGRGDLNGYLVAGSDGTPSVGRADVIYFAVRGGGSPVLFIIPRSLYLPNPCTGSPVRAALLLRGCPGVASGPSLLGLALGDFTGVNVNGFAVVGYSGFPKITDALGGIEICSDTPRGVDGRVIVPAGCNTLDGSAAAWWITNRSQDELVNGQWQAVAGDDEMSRSQRQAQALQAVIGKVRSFSSIGSIINVANKVSDTFALGGISLTEAASLANSTRSGYQIASIPTHSEVTPEGIWVLYPDEPFSATLARYGL